ncbi:hypothetical protein MRBLMA1_000522 [Sphingobium sp. LMA1-1-1.1]|uniref:hypothetical protein n=1 Tax=Sphingobium sp. LMA1-1-1.1 TaxID=3135238 RepID=UPI0034162364
MARNGVSTPKFDLSHFSRHRSRIGHLKLIWREMGRLGLERHDLAPYQSEMLRDLADGLDEETLAEMHNYWEYNTEQLFRRKRDRWGPDGIPAKPRIDVVLEMTSKGNFKAEWFPRGWNRWGPALEDHIGSDFPVWRRYNNRGMGFDTRPSNELFFVRGTSHAVHHIEMARADRWFLALDPVLLAACHALTGELKERLQRHFDVRMVTDLFLEWRTIKIDTDSYFDEADELASWAIEDPETVEERKGCAELAAGAFGFSHEQLVDCWLAESEKPRCPDVTTSAFKSRIVKTLKAQGYSTTTRQLDRYLALIKKYEPERARDLMVTDVGKASGA